MIRVELAKLDLVTNIPVNQFHATGLRGSVGNLEMLVNRSEFHHHKDEKLVYSHPKIQYRVENGMFHMVGIQEGAFLLKALPPIEKLEIYNQVYFTQNHTNSLVESIGLDEFIYEYKIITPWIALNQDNVKVYRTLKTRNERNEFLGKKLIGNLLSFSKTIQYEVPDTITIQGNFYEYGKAYSNDIKLGLIGFLGTFETNFKLPLFGWGLGKWSSRGYGIVRERQV